MVNAMKVASKISKKISNLAKGIAQIFGRLIGIKKTKEDKYDITRLTNATWTFIVGIPIGLLLVGEAFPIAIWGVIVFIFLTVISIDETVAFAQKCFREGVN